QPTRAGWRSSRCLEGTQASYVYGHAVLRAEGRNNMNMFRSAIHRCRARVLKFRRELRAGITSQIGVSLIGLLISAGTAQAANVTKKQFLTGVTSPSAGLILNGSSINPATGKNYRFLWTADDGNGICRFDPDLNETSPALPGHAAINTCTPTIAGLA